MLPIGMIAAVAVTMMDTCGMPPEQVNIPTEAVVVSTETVVIPTEAVVQEPPKVEEGKIYTIYGIAPPAEWQRYLYSELATRGYAWYMPYAMCQIWQESRWNQWSDNGRDFGLTQQKGIYWSDRAALYGIPGADIWDPYAQLHVFACQMSGYLAETGNDVGRALSAYYLGTWDFSQRYVDCVMEHWGALGEAR